jgi:hypothetical protein
MKELNNFIKEKNLKPGKISYNFSNDPFLITVADDFNENPELIASGLCKTPLSIIPSSLDMMDSS